MRVALQIDIAVDCRDTTGDMRTRQYNIAVHVTDGAADLRGVAHRERAVDARNRLIDACAGLERDATIDRV